MTDLRKAAEMALEALDSCEFDYDWEERPYKTFDETLVNDAVDALRKALDHVPDTMKMLEPDMGIDRGAWDDVPDATKWVDELRGGDETEQEPVAWMTNSEQDTTAEYMFCHVQTPMHDIPLYEAPPSKQEQEFVTWRNAAIRLGEDLYSVGPDGYYDMTAKQWLDWALSVVTAPPSKPWVSLTDEELSDIYNKNYDDYVSENIGIVDFLMIAGAVEATLNEKNT